MTVLLDAKAAGVQGPIINIKGRLGDMLVTAAGTGSQTADIYVSGSTHGTDFIKFGTVTLANGVGFLEKITGDLELNPFERIYAQAGSGNANNISVYLQTSH